eukprot:jgi/Tetstr1/461422/TSEL_006532.t1
MPDGEEPVAEPTLESLNADMRAQSSLLRELATAVAQLTARDRVVDGEGAHGSGSGQRFAGQPTGSGGAAERPDLLELAQSGRVGAKSVSAEDDYLAVPELLQRAESGYEAVRPVSRVPGLFPLSTDLTNEYLKQDDRRLPAREEYLWMSCFGAHMAALFVALDELPPYVPATNQDFTPYLARARNHAEAIDKAFRFRLAFLRRLNEIKRRLQLQDAGAGEDVAVDVDVAAKDAFGSDELAQRTLDLLSSSLSAQTLKSYAGRLSQFAEFCHDSENISPLEATTATVVRYVAWIGERGHIAAKSLQRYLSAVNTFFELHNLVPIAKDSLHLTSARQSHLDYRALLASVVNFLFFARGLTGVSCRVQDVHVDTYNITLQIYREKGRAGRRGPDDMRVLLLPVSEHPRVTRLLRYFIDNIQSVPLRSVPPLLLPTQGSVSVFGMSKLQAVAVAVVVATAIFASASAEAMETVPGVPELVVPPVGYNEEKDAIFFAKPELSAMNSRGKEMRGKRVNKAAIDYDGECGGHIDRPVGIRNYAPKSLRRRQNDLTNQFMRDATTYGKNIDCLIVGDSIMEDLGDKSSCESTIFDEFSKKCLNWGISGIDTYFAATLVQWIFTNSVPKLQPKVVYLAVGINDCTRGRDASKIVDNLILIIKAIKHSSPHTRVVVQGLLPTTYKDTTDADGETWDEDEELKWYDCVTAVNTDILTWIQGNAELCIEYEDQSDVVLDDDDKFNDALKDGLHFDQGNMNKYCKAIADAIKDHADVEIDSFQGNVFTHWHDVQPLPIEGETTQHLWHYNEWSNCTGNCGVQRRTVECHAVEVASGASHTVEEALCINVFMNPLERVCNIEPDCEAKLGRLESLLRFPIPLSQVTSKMEAVPISSHPSSSDCSTSSPVNAIYIAAISALALGVVVLGAVAWRASMRAKKADRAAKAMDPAAAKEAALNDMESVRSSEISTVVTQ